jgi:hypothetical protein
MNWLWLAIPLGIAAAIWIYDFIEAKTLVHDLFDEWKLGKQDLDSFDRAWRSNPNRSDVVVSLTTIPSRLDCIDGTLKSLMRQSLAPAEIRLNVPAYSKRENVAYVVPERLKKLAALTVVDCDKDWGPSTKVIPPVLSLPEDQRIVVVDDDRIYSKNLIADLDAASAAQPDSVFGLCGWVVPPDLVHRPANLWTVLFIRPPAPILARRIHRPWPMDIVRGVGGYCVKPRFFDKEALVDYSGAPDAAFFVDDIWVSAHCHAPKFVIPAKRSNYRQRRNRRFYDATSLGRINNRGEADMANRNNSIVVQHFADAWKIGGRNQGS